MTLPVAFSQHALGRMHEMGVGQPEVTDTLRTAEVDIPDSVHDDRRIAVKGRLRVVYVPEPDGPKVCTVMWQGRDSRAAGPLATVHRNGTAARQRPGRNRSELTDRILSWYREHPGQSVPHTTIVETFEITNRVANNTLANLCRAGDLERVGRGVYRYPVVHTPAPESDPLVRLQQIQDRLDAEATTEPDTPVETAPVAHMPVVVVASLDDEIDAILELLVPGGVKARHLNLAVRWCEATRALLEATR